MLFIYADELISPIYNSLHVFRQPLMHVFILFCNWFCKFCKFIVQFLFHCRKLFISYTLCLLLLSLFLFASDLNILVYLLILGWVIEVIFLCFSLLFNQGLKLFCFLYKFSIQLIELGILPLQLFYKILSVCEVILFSVTERINLLTCNKCCIITLLLDQFRFLLEFLTHDQRLCNRSLQFSVLFD